MNDSGALGPDAGMKAEQDLREQLSAISLEIIRLKEENRKLQNRIMQFVWVNLDLQDINDGLAGRIAELGEMKDESR